MTRSRLRMTLLLLPVIVCGCAAQPTIQTKCPLPFPWPGEEVIDYMQAGSERSGGVATWWRDVIRLGEACDALDDV